MPEGRFQDQPNSSCEGSFQDQSKSFDVPEGRFQDQSKSTDVSEGSRDQSKTANVPEGSHDQSKSTDVPEGSRDQSKATDQPEGRFQGQSKPTCMCDEGSLQDQPKPPSMFEGNFHDARSRPNDHRVWRRKHPRSSVSSLPTRPSPRDFSLPDSGQICPGGPDRNPLDVLETKMSWGG